MSEKKGVISIKEEDLEQVTGGMQNLNPSEFYGNWSSVMFSTTGGDYWLVVGKNAPTTCPVCNGSTSQNGYRNGAPKYVCANGHVVAFAKI